MRRIILIFFAFSILASIQSAHCQYLPIGVLPMEYNPSFAGSVGNSRLVTNFSFYRNSTYNHNAGGFDVSYDNYFPALRSGIGIVTKIGGYSVTHQNENTFNIWTTSTELSVAPKISIKGKYTLSPSVSIQYGTFYSGYTERIYGDDFSSKFGLLFNASHYYIGYAAEYYYGSSGLTTALQFGYTFQKGKDSKFSFTPQFALPILINSGVGIYWPSYKLSFRYGGFILGAISQFEYPLPTGFQVGWQKKGCRVLFNNNFKQSYNAHLTLRYIFNHNKKSIHILDKIY